MSASPTHQAPLLHEHVFSSSATVFTLEDKNWTERGCGLVKFIFDSISYQLRLVINPQTDQEFECRLRPRIRSKGPRAYVVRANSLVRDDELGEELILAIRFDRELDSRSFRRFVEERDQPSLSNFADGRTQSRGNMHPTQHSGNGYRESRASPPGREYHDRYPAHPTSYDDHPGEQAFFWSCSRCTMMNDAHADACYVCGTQRTDVNVARAAPPDRAAGGGSDVPMPHYGSGGGGYGGRGGHGHSGHGAGYHGHSSSTPTAASPQPVRMQEQLTQQNLERMNLLYPPKKRPVLDIILEQLRLQERLAMQDR